MTAADLLLLNGRVHTVDANGSVVEALAIAGHRVFASGTSAEIRKLAGPSSEVVDLAGRTVLPGFIDAHVHMGAFGTNKLGIDCKADGMRSIEAIKQAIRERARETPPGTWIRAHGYDHTRLAEQRHPSRWDLDEAAPDHPVIVVRTCVHIAAANSRALELARISDDTPDPAGGIRLLESGVPGGAHASERPFPARRNHILSRRRRDERPADPRAAGLRT